MADLLVIVGPPAVGKASVGTALAAKTGWKLFHNHLTVEPVGQLMGWGHPRFSELAWQLRMALFQAALADSAHPGVIFTFVWAFDEPEDTAEMVALRELFLAHGRRVRFVELSADLPTRLNREGTPQRLKMKPSKHDVEFARANSLHLSSKYQLNSDGDFPWPNDWQHISTEQYSAEQAATQIIAQWPELFAAMSVEV